ncbi:LURP1-related protein domain containing protein [Heracleum sosnowskyi]|uniref:LURP1-related protein domain containing protein n=1 Tax=Heracleum sosnowskyi TaxID=360622 RepID=A0AAD8HXY9_9APIA|nr:LURP1-related protein domain containing protein [Heracleum sosnowskyi]
MFKVSPQINQTPANSTRENTYTIWMKSLLFNGCGCTIFNSDGEIVYRIDNYNKKRGSQVQVMNLHGEVLLLLRRKRFRIFEQWEGFRWSVSGEMTRQKAWFNVRRECKILRRSMTSCHVNFGSDDKVRENCYRIVGFPGKSGLKIIRGENKLVAEVKRKQSSSGVILGEDVLSLRVEASPQINHLLIMALVIVYGLIEQKL